MSATDLDDLIPSPVYSYEEESCVTIPWVGKVCVTWYAVTLYVRNPSLGATTLDLDPQSSGKLKATFTVEDPSLDWSASGTVTEIDYSGSGDISADSITVTMTLTPYVSSGDIHASVDSVSVSSSGFDFDVDSWLYDALEYVGIDFDGLIQGYMEDAIEDVVYSAVPDLVESTFQDLEIGYDFDVGDASYTMTAIPDDIDVDATGMTLSLETSFVSSEWVSAYYGEGSLYYGYSDPSWSTSDGMVLGVNADFLNQVFLAFWGGGLLDMTLTDEDLGVSVEDLALVLTDLEDLTITTEALLPPVVVPGTGDAMFDLQVGDLLLTLYNGPAESGYEYIQVYVSAVAGFDIDASSDLALTPAIGDVTLYFDVVYPEASSSKAAAIEELLETLTPLVLPMLTEALVEVPVPQFEGFSITGISVGTSGAEGGFATIGGDLDMD